MTNLQGNVYQLKGRINSKILGVKKLKQIGLRTPIMFQLLPLDTEFTISTIISCTWPPGSVSRS